MQFPWPAGVAAAVCSTQQHNTGSMYYSSQVNLEHSPMHHHHHHHVIAQNNTPSSNGVDFWTWLKFSLPSECPDSGILLTDSPSEPGVGDSCSSQHTKSFVDCAVGDDCLLPTIDSMATQTSPMLAHTCSTSPAPSSHSTNSAGSSMPRSADTMSLHRMPTTITTTITHNTMGLSGLYIASRIAELDKRLNAIKMDIEQLHYELDVVPSNGWFHNDNEAPPSASPIDDAKKVPSSHPTCMDLIDMTSMKKDTCGQEMIEDIMHPTAVELSLLNAMQSIQKEWRELRQQVRALKHGKWNQSIEEKLHNLIQSRKKAETALRNFSKPSAHSLSLLAFVAAEMNEAKTLESDTSSILQSFLHNGDTFHPSSTSSASLPVAFATDINKNKNHSIIKDPSMTTEQLSVSTLSSSTSPNNFSITSPQRVSSASSHLLLSTVTSPAFFSSKDILRPLLDYSKPSQKNPSYSSVGSSEDDIRPPTPDLRRCDLDVNDLSPDQRILFVEDSHLRPGCLLSIVNHSSSSALSHVWRIQLPGDRRPIVDRSAYELINEAVLEVQPTSLRHVPPGTRVCAHWSQQLCDKLFPGTVVHDDSVESNHLAIDFDDKDFRHVPLDQVRMLPEKFDILSLPDSIVMNRAQRMTTSASRKRGISSPLLVSLETSSNNINSSSGGGKKARHSAPAAEESKSAPSSKVSRESPSSCTGKSSNTPQIVWMGMGDCIKENKAARHYLSAKRLLDGHCVTVGDSVKMSASQPSRGAAHTFHGQQRRRRQQQQRQENVFLGRIMKIRQLLTSGKRGTTASSSSKEEQWGEVYVTVQWYYSPPEASRLCSDPLLQSLPHGAVLRSDHTDENEARTILSSVQVDSNYSSFLEHCERKRSASKKGSSIHEELVREEGEDKKTENDREALEDNDEDDDDEEEGDEEGMGDSSDSEDRSHYFVAGRISTIRKSIQWIDKTWLPNNNNNNNNNNNHSGSSVC